MDVDKHLAERVRNLRKSQGLTLERLAELSGVSKSMISLIEREETSPTAAVLDKLAGAFRISLPALFSYEADDAFALPLARADTQPLWKDPESGYVRRHVSPPGFQSPMELVEVTFPAGKSVSFDSPTRGVTCHQVVWLLDGEMEITIDGKPWRLRSGDCLAMVLNRPISFRNPTRKAARYAIALTAVSDLFRKFR